jgi:hypothetical protein
MAVGGGAEAVRQRFLKRGADPEIAPDSPRSVAAGRCSELQRMAVCAALSGFGDALRENDACPPGCVFRFPVNLMSASAASADAPQPPIPPLRLSGLEPLVIDEHSLFVNVGECTNVSGSKAFDVQWLIELLQAQGVPIVISQRPAFVH